jgi:hypothetical protein
LYLLFLSPSFCPFLSLSVPLLSSFSISLFLYNIFISYGVVKMWVLPCYITTTILYKNFWGQLIAYFSFMQHGPHKNEKIKIREGTDTETAKWSHKLQNYGKYTYIEENDFISFIILKK